MCVYIYIYIYNMYTSYTILCHLGRIRDSGNSAGAAQKKHTKTQITYISHINKPITNKSTDNTHTQQQTQPNKQQRHTLKEQLPQGPLTSTTLPVEEAEEDERPLTYRPAAVI